MITLLAISLFVTVRATGRLAMPWRRLEEAGETGARQGRRESRHRPSAAVTRQRLPALILALVAILAWEIYVRANDIPVGILPAPSIVARSLVADGESSLRTSRRQSSRSGSDSPSGWRSVSALRSGSTTRRCWLGPSSRSCWRHRRCRSSRSRRSSSSGSASASSRGGRRRAGRLLPSHREHDRGLREVDPGILALMRTFPAGERQVLHHVRLPNSVPYLVPAAQVGMTYAVIGAVISEWIGPDPASGGSWSAPTRSPGRTNSSRRCSSSRSWLSSWWAWSVSSVGA